jgi:hypothetical protein
VQCLNGVCDHRADYKRIVLGNVEKLLGKENDQFAILQSDNAEIAIRFAQDRDNVLRKMKGEDLGLAAGLC